MMGEQVNVMVDGVATDGGIRHAVAILQKEVEELHQQRNEISEVLSYITRPPEPTTACDGNKIGSSESPLEEQLYGLRDSLQTLKSNYTELLHRLRI